MTAAVAHRPAGAVQAPAPQLTLLGGCEPPAAPEVKLSLVGQLQRRAEVRISGDGRVHLCVQILQPHHGAPFIAVFHGEPGQRLELEHLAEGLVPGAAVLLVFRRLDIAQHDGRAALRIAHCDAIQRVDADLFLTDPQINNAEA